MFVAKFKRIVAEAKIPVYNFESAGMDFFSIEKIIVKSGKQRVISTGLIWEPKIPKRYKKFFKPYLQIEGRSGLALKNGISILGGIIDCDYRGIIKIIINNAGSETLVINVGDKIAQGIFHLIPKVKIKEVENINNTERGKKGFGSSGAR